MTLQAKLNKQALDYFPKIKNLIANANTFDANQMLSRIFQMINNTAMPVDTCTHKELTTIQDNYIKYFKFKGWA